MTKHNLIRNSAVCKSCNEEIMSRDRHDFVRCKCGAIAVDGGTDYLRRVGDFNLIQDTSLYDDEPHSVQRQTLTWGTYGKDGLQPYRRITVAEMETEHIEAILCEYRVSLCMKTCMINELKERGVEWELELSQ